MESLKPIATKPIGTGAKVTEGYQRITENAKNSFIGALSYITIFSILFVAVAVFFADVQLSDIKAVTELSLTIAILWFCGYSIYFVTFDMGGRSAKLQAAYIKAQTENAEIKKNVTRTNLKEYCEWRTTEELLSLRKSIVTDEAGIDFSVYTKKYLGKNKKELLAIFNNGEQERITKQQLKAIVKANRLKPLNIKPEHALQEDKGYYRRSPFAKSPKNKKIFLTIKKTIFSIALAVLGGSIAFSLILEFSWATVVACLFKLLTIIVSAAFGYKAGYNIIIDDTVAYVTSQTEFLKGYLQWEKENKKEIAQQEILATQPI